MLAVGSHKFEVHSLGPNGEPPLILPLPYEWEVILPPDVTPPDTQIILSPPTLTGTYIVNFEFTGIDDPTATFQCALDTLVFTACPDPSVFTVTAGEHTLRVRAIDAASNIDPTPDSYTWTANPDTTAPTTTIATAPAATTEFADTNFSFHSNEPGSTFECALDSTTLLPCASPAEYGD